MYYYTQENEILDYICFKHYGFTSGAVEKVLELDLQNMVVFCPQDLRFKLEKMPQKSIVRILD